MHQPRFEITRTPQTEAAATAFLTELDAQIDELTANLELLQAVRRATASAFGVDRREGVGTFGEITDAARRAEYEGEGDPTDKVGRLVPRGRPPREKAGPTETLDDGTTMLTRVVS
jgi:hypothetical protein